MLVFHSLEITKTPSSGCCLGGAVCAHQSWALLLGDTCPRCPVGLWLLACFTAKGEGLGDWIWSAWDGGHLHTEALVDTIIALVQTTSINTLPQRKQGLTPGLSVAGSPKTPGTKTMCSVDTPRWKPYKKQLMEVLHCRCLYANKEKTKYRSSPGRPGAVCPIPTCMASDEQPGRDATGAISLQCFLCPGTAPPLLGRARLDTIRGLSVLEQRGSFSVYSQAQVNETFSMPFKTNKDGSNTACYLQHNLTDVSL